MDPFPNSTPVLKPINQISITISSWNIRRGLVIREQELKEILRTNSINDISLSSIMFTEVSIHIMSLPKTYLSDN